MLLVGCVFFSTGKESPELKENIYFISLFCWLKPNSMAKNRAQNEIRIQT